MTSPFLPKPAYGAPCNHCGQCCIAALCGTAKLIFGADHRGTCPALMWTKDGSACGLMSRPERFAPTRARIEGAGRIRDAAKLLIGSGVGCCFPTQNEPVDVAFRDRIKNRLTRQQRIAALRTLGLLKSARARDAAEAALA